MIAIYIVALVADLGWIWLGGGGIFPFLSVLSGVRRKTMHVCAWDGCMHLYETYTYTQNMEVISPPTYAI